MNKLTRIRVTGIVKNKEKFLLLLRHYPMNLWEFPSGTINFGETPEEAVKREVKEESGLNVTSKGLFAVNSCSYKEFDDEMHEIVIAYLFETNEKDINLSVNKEKEHSEYKWVKLGELNKIPNLAFTVRCILDKINNNFNSSVKSS